MIGHHILTLVLFVAAHTCRVERMGFLVLALLNFSNPFLHFAKIMNYTGQPANIKTPAFLLFAVAFALSRCIVFPMMLKTSWDAVHQHLQDGDRTVLVPAVVMLGGNGVLQLLQFYWMHRIIRCATQWLGSLCLAASARRVAKAARTPIGTGLLVLCALVHRALHHEELN
jgi:TLC domain